MNKFLKMKFDKKFFNVIVLGFSFMFIFTAFQTSGMMQTKVLDSFKKIDDSYTGNGYTSLAVIYAVLAVTNWLAPSALTLTGPKMAMIIGGLTYSLFIANFLYPMTWGLYVASVLIGMGAALIWTGQGNFLTENSDSETMSRNSGIFWAMLQCSLLFGNAFVFVMFQGKEDVDNRTRVEVYGSLLGVCCVGCILLLALRGGGRLRKEDESAGTVIQSPKQAFVSSLKLFKTRKMILLSITFLYTGFELSFFSGVYGTCLSYTKRFGDDAQKYIGVSGMLIGTGEIIGGALFGILGSKTNRYGRDLIVMLGYVVHMITFFLVFINLPDHSPIGETFQRAYIDSNIYIALVCSFTLGFGDACFNTQVYSILGYVYSEDSAPAFALFKFVQSLAAAVAFFYSNVIILRYQLLILVVMGTVGALSYCQVEWATHRMAKRKREDVQDDIVDGKP